MNFETNPRFKDGIPDSLLYNSEERRIQKYLKVDEQ